MTTDKWELVAKISKAETGNGRVIQPLILEFIAKYGLAGNEAHEKMICEKDSECTTDKRTIIGYMVYLWGIPSEMIVYHSYEEANNRLKEIAKGATSSTHQETYNYSVKRIVSCVNPFINE